MSDVYGLCDSEIVHVDQSLSKSRYGPLDVEMTKTLHQVSLGQLSFSEPLKNVYLESRVEAHITESSRWTVGIYLRHIRESVRESEWVESPTAIPLLPHQPLGCLYSEGEVVIF